MMSVFGSFYGPERIEMLVTTEEEMRKAFDEFLDKTFAPKLNKIQKLLYGDRVNSMTRATLQEIVDNNRGMGNTTAHAMKQIAEAIQNPGKAIKLEPDVPLQGHATYHNFVQDIIQKMDLKFLVIRRTPHTLTYEV